MTSEGLKFKYLDASALVKLYINESGSQQLRDFFNTETNFLTTWLCLAEALGVLKRKWKKKGIEKDEYLKAVTSLMIEWRDRIESGDIKSFDPSVPLKVKEVAEKFNLDYSDALQLWTLQSGRLSSFRVESAPNVYESALFLITGDGDLASAVRSEKIKVWNCNAGPAPKWAY